MPWDIVGNVIVGWIKHKSLQKWMQIIASMSASVFVTFIGTWGLSIGALYAQYESISIALGLGFGCALVTSAGIFIFAWKKHDLTKKIPLFFPSRLNKGMNEELRGQGIDTINAPR